MIDQKIWDEIFVRSRYEDSTQVALIMGAEAIVIPQGPDSVAYRHWCRMNGTKHEECLIKSLFDTYLILADSDELPHIAPAMTDICKMRFCEGSPGFHLLCPDKG